MGMTIEKKCRCIKCGLVVTIQSDTTPDSKLGGPCPKSSDGNHSWINA